MDFFFFLSDSVFLFSDSSLGLSAVFQLGWWDVRVNLWIAVILLDRVDDKLVLDKGFVGLVLLFQEVLNYWVDLLTFRMDLMCGLELDKVGVFGQLIF